MTLLPTDVDPVPARHNTPIRNAGEHLPDGHPTPKSSNALREPCK